METSKQFETFRLPDNFEYLLTLYDHPRWKHNLRVVYCDNGAVEMLERSYWTKKEAMEVTEECGHCPHMPKPPKKSPREVRALNKELQEAEDAAQAEYEKMHKMYIEQMIEYNKNEDIRTKEVAAKHLLLSSLHPSVAASIDPSGNVCDVMDCINARYALDDSVIRSAKEQLEKIKLEDFPNMTEYFNKGHKLLHVITPAGCALSLDVLRRALHAGLSVHYNNVKPLWSYVLSATKTVDKLANLLFKWECMIIGMHGEKYLLLKHCDACGWNPTHSDERCNRHKPGKANTTVANSSSSYHGGNGSAGHGRSIVSVTVGHQHPMQTIDTSDLCHYSIGNDPRTELLFSTREQL